ncbi:hypothetical protein PC117_g25754 [Phytophthora cactorum]|uniref:Uncharacterized protein n=1 Tax=Phytophthora cactorum TaxID=29920 RepID=A0A8T1AMF7_9STRA|nr:hypothetical protein PC117_g25754 [Phytophthora cactorum]
MPSELMEASDEIVAPLIRHRIKVLRCSLSVINDGEVALNREAISDALGIHGARSVGTERGEEGVTGVGAFSSSSLRERFELEALGSSSRSRRDPVTAHARLRPTRSRLLRMGLPRPPWGHH